MPVLRVCDSEVYPFSRRVYTPVMHVHALLKPARPTHGPSIFYMRVRAPDIARDTEVCTVYGSFTSISIKHCLYVYVMQVNVFVMLISVINSEAIRL